MKSMPMMRLLPQPDPQPSGQQVHGPVAAVEHDKQQREHEAGVLVDGVDVLYARDLHLDGLGLLSELRQESSAPGRDMDTAASSDGCGWDVAVRGA